MVMFREVCDQVPRLVPRVECDTRMKEIELKEICVDIDIQLPREECKKEEREECKYEPREVIVQRCEPTVKEICEPSTKTICNDKCKEQHPAWLVLKMMFQVRKLVRSRTGACA